MQKIVVIRTEQELADLRAVFLDSEDYIAFDVETTGVDKDSKIIGFSLAVDEEVGYYVVISYWDTSQKILVETSLAPLVGSFIEQVLLGAKLIMHNGPFDCMMVNQNYGIDLMPYVHTDTLVLGHLLDENRSNGLKELGTAFWGEDAKAEQIAMKASVHANGGVLTKDNYELYKADSQLMAEYGAKDAILTIKVFYKLVEDLYEQGLEDFFYKDESMPLLRGPTYDLNTTGLKVDPIKLQQLKSELELSCLRDKTFVMEQVAKHVAKKYPKGNFNIGSSKQLAWLLFVELNNTFEGLTKEARNLCKALDIKRPYSAKQKREFISFITQHKGRVYEEAKFNPKTRKMGRPKKIGDVWNYLSADKATLKIFANKYKWVETLLEHTKNLKLLNTYVEGIQSRMKYNVIRPSFLQHGTTSGRYSSKNPNFQNLPRDDKRVKACIVARPGKVFVGADYSQLEPRVFASFSKDERLLASFKNGEDFYSVIGAQVFGIHGLSLVKDDPGSFAEKHKDLRTISKVIALSSAYGTTAAKMAPAIGKDIGEAQEIIDDYFTAYPGVKAMMLESHAQAMKDGQVVNLFGRPRRMPKAKLIKQIYGNTSHADLPYEIRNILNLAVNHRIQSTGASIVNRAAIAFKVAIRESQIPACYIVSQIHDEIVVECNEQDQFPVQTMLKEAMEHTVELPGVDLIAEPKIAKNLGDLK